MTSLCHVILILLLCNTTVQIVLHASPTSNLSLANLFSKSFLEKEIYLVLHNLFRINQYNFIFLLLSKLILKRFHYSISFLGLERRSTIPKEFLLFSPNSTFLQVPLTLLLLHVTAKHQDTARVFQHNSLNLLVLLFLIFLVVQSL